MATFKKRRHSSLESGKKDKLKVMKFYQVKLTNTHHPELDPFYTYWSNKREATRAANKWMNVVLGSNAAAIKVIEVEASRKGILAALQRYAGQQTTIHGGTSEDDIGADRPG